MSVDKIVNVFLNIPQIVQDLFKKTLIFIFKQVDKIPIEIKFIILVFAFTLTLIIIYFILKNKNDIFHVYH